MAADTDNIAHCHRCRHRQRPCNGPCACQIDGQDIIEHATSGICPLGLFRAPEPMPPGMTPTIAAAQARSGGCCDPPTERLKEQTMTPGQLFDALKEKHDGLLSIGTSASDNYVLGFASADGSARIACQVPIFAVANIPAGNASRKYPAYQKPCTNADCALET